MKTSKKLLAIILAFGCSLSMGCNSNSSDSGDTGDGGTISQREESGVVEGDTVKGQYLTQEQWRDAITAVYAVDNVTLICNASCLIGETQVCYWEEKATIKIANNSSYEVEERVYFETGQSRFSEIYVIQEDGVYHEWDRTRYDGYGIESWVGGWSHYAYEEGEYVSTLGGWFDRHIVMCNFDWMVSLYSSLQYDAQTGEYSVFIPSDEDPFTIVFEFQKGKLCVFKVISEFKFEEDTFGRCTWEYILQDDGTTVIGTPPDFRGEN